MYTCGTHGHLTLKALVGEASVCTVTRNHVYVQACKRCFPEDCGCHMGCSGTGSDQAQLGQAHVHVSSLVALTPFSGSPLKHRKVIGLQGMASNDRLTR